MTGAKSYPLPRAILAAAVSDGLTQTNQCRVGGAGVERSAERPIVGSELVLELADAIGVRWRAMTLLAGFAGLRLGELLALREQHGAGADGPPGPRQPGRGSAPPARSQGSGQSRRRSRHDPADHPGFIGAIDAR